MFAITQQIPVSDHVYKYLVARCGSNNYIASRSSFVGSVVLSMLSPNNDIRGISKKQFNRTFTLTIKEEKYLRNGVHISYKNALLFNNLIDKMFREELFTHAVVIADKFGLNYLDAIKQFLEVYSIGEDDIKLETLYKDFKRKRDGLQAQLKLSLTAWFCAPFGVFVP